MLGKTPRALLFLLLLGLLLAPVVEAEVIRYRDENGRIHMVTDRSKVPAQYRDQLGPSKTTGQKTTTGELVAALAHFDSFEQPS